MQNPFNFSTADALMYAAYSQAVKGEGCTRPNPPVGAVIVKGNKIIGSGYHAYAGADHAEVVAIKDCKVSPAGATMYVTLEPCSKAGRVGPCTEAIIKAGIKHVVYACEDPNPKNRGKAKRILKKAGITCEKVEGLGRGLCKTLIDPFEKYIKTGLPYVTVKIAMSLDGRICDKHGRAKWISSADMRKTTDLLRHKVDAIMVGAETIRLDNPTLLPHKGENPNLIRVVISKSGKLPIKSKVLSDGRNQTLVFSDPKTALKELGRMGCLHVLCEGGMKLAVSMAQAGLVDEWKTILTPLVIGERPLAKAARVENFVCLQD